MAHRVVFSLEARKDLRAIYDYIADRAGAQTALRYVQRISDYCRGFETFPERGTKRDDLLPGLRVVGFKRRVSIAFHVGTEAVTFDRILYGGQDLTALARPAKPEPIDL